MEPRTIDPAPTRALHADVAGDRSMRVLEAILALVSIGAAALLAALR